MATNVDHLISKTNGVLIAATVFSWINFVIQLVDVGLSATILAKPILDIFDQYGDVIYEEDRTSWATAAVAISAVNLVFVAVPAAYVTFLTVQFGKYARSTADVQTRPNKGHGISLTVLGAVQLAIAIAGIGVAAT